MLCPRCGTNYVTSGYCQTCLKQINPDPHMILPDEVPEVVRPSLPARLIDRLVAVIGRGLAAGREWARSTFGSAARAPALSVQHVRIVIASAVPGLGLMLTGETGLGIKYFFGALGCFFFSITSGSLLLSLVLASGSLTLAYWGALRAVRPKVAITRAQARGHVVMVLLILALIYLSAYGLLGLFYSPMQLNYPIPDTPFRSGDQLLIATYGTPRTGEWVYIEKNTRLEFDVRDRRFGLTNSPLQQYDPQTMKPDGIDGRVVVRYSPLGRFGRIP